MSLGSVIGALEAYERDGGDLDKVVAIGFKYPHSYRGYYEQLAFEPATYVSLRSMLDCAREALGNTYEGYKGGSYTMHDYTETWLAEYGDTSDDMLGPVLMRFLVDQPAVA